MLLPRRDAVIHSFPYFVPIFLPSFWDLRLGWGSSGNLATSDSGKVGFLYQDHQLQILLLLNLNKKLVQRFLLCLKPTCRELPYTVDEAETLPLATVIPSKWKKGGRKVGDVSK